MISLGAQLQEERFAKQRQYVLANTRARWGFVGFGIALLVGVTLAGIVTISPWFILAFAAACALGSVYGFLQGAWPFGAVEAIWALVALRRWRRAQGLLQQ